VADSDVSDGSGTSATYQGADSRAGQGGGQHQTRKEARSSAGQDVGDARERLSVERESSVGMAHDHRDVQEGEVRPGPTPIPTQPGDLVSDLIGPLHVVVPDGPQMRGCGHCRSSYSWAVTLSVAG